MFYVGLATSSLELRIVLCFFVFGPSHGVAGAAAYHEHTSLAPRFARPLAHNSDGRLLGWSLMYEDPHSSVYVSIFGNVEMNDAFTGTLYFDWHLQSQQREPTAMIKLLTRDSFRGVRMSIQTTAEDVESSSPLTVFFLARRLTFVDSFCLLRDLRRQLQAGELGTAAMGCVVRSALNKRTGEM